MNNAAATAARALTVFNSGSPGSYPIDPVMVARSLGINVYSAKLDNNVSGMIVKADPEGDVSILLNSEHASVRQRFTCAHELGHYFAIQQQADGATRTYIHKRDSLSACGVDGGEIYANQFAAELLMPETMVRALRELGTDVYDLASKFVVSLDAMVNRLKNLSLA